ncbi:hypothetical protein LCGC14_0959930 [marine sediment metagenome]|uniref:Uncharacterized protein n=1 Tax=marine sediment metagenome TaxID=412755 RepID=A0A0F9NJG9_9ZZZZ
MFKDTNLGIHQILELIKDSYKNIDFRCALFKEDGNWNRIITIIRFSNESPEIIKNRFINLDLKKYNIQNLKIIYDVIEVSRWEEKLFDIYDELNDDIEIYDSDEFTYNNDEYEDYIESFLDEFITHYNTKTVDSFSLRMRLNIIISLIIIIISPIQMSIMRDLILI